MTGKPPNIFEFTTELAADDLSGQCNPILSEHTNLSYKRATQYGPTVCTLALQAERQLLIWHLYNRRVAIKAGDAP